jgi:MFS family permease
VASIGGIAFALITLPVGILADKYGIRRILMAALLLMTGGARATMNVCPMICGGV